ncbi:MAG: DUF2905 domain-containing protein [Leptospirales bacterium]
MARVFLFLGLFFLGLSLVARLAEKGIGKSIFSVLGHLPGDIVINRPGFKFYFPLMTSLLVSAGVSLLLYLFSRFSGRP